jgi:hypothetical protein
MKVLKLRTKIEIIFTLVILLTIVVSATVTITDVRLTTTDSGLELNFANGMINTSNVTVSNTLVIVPSTEPTSPTAGMIYVNATNNKFYFYNGSVWIEGTTLLSSGTALNCYNGSWIAHGLPKNPTGSGSITISLRGSSNYNATRILRVPTIVQSNDTHFQIEFLMWDTTTWTLAPVDVAAAQTVYWDAIYRSP